MHGGDAAGASNARFRQIGCIEVKVYAVPDTMSVSMGMCNRRNALHQREEQQHQISRYLAHE